MSQPFAKRFGAQGCPSPGPEPPSDCSVDMFAFGRVCFFVSTGRLPLQEFTVDDLMPGIVGSLLVPSRTCSDSGSKAV